MINIEEFAAEVERKIGFFLTEDAYKEAKFFHREVVKNNNVRYMGLSVKVQGDKPSPLLYLEPFYNSYVSGTPMETVIKEIADIFNRKCPIDMKEIEQLREFSSVKDRIIFRLVNKAENEEMLSGMPHRDIADLTLTYLIAFDIVNECDAVVKITNQMMEQYGVTEEQLYELAMENTPKRMKIIMEPVEAVIADLCGVKSDKRESDVQMYVATNQQRIGGAAVVLYEDFDSLSRKAVGDYYILPSSTEEVIIVPRECMNPKILREIVREINRSKVSAEQVLSDNVYEILDGEFVAAA